MTRQVQILVFAGTFCWQSPRFYGGWRPDYQGCSEVWDGTTLRAASFGLPSLLLFAGLLGFLFGFEFFAGGADAMEKLRGRFVARVLRDQLATERFCEDGLVQLLSLIHI